MRRESKLGLGLGLALVTRPQNLNYKSARNLRNVDVMYDDAGSRDLSPVK